MHLKDLLVLTVNRFVLHYCWGLFSSDLIVVCMEKQSLFFITRPDLSAESLVSNQALNIFKLHLVLSKHIYFFFDNNSVWFN